MASDLFVKIFLINNLKQTDVVKFLDQASSENLKMYDYIPGETYFDSPQLNKDKALKIILGNDPEASLLCRFLDISFFMFFSLHTPEKYIWIMNTGYPLKKEFLNGKATIEFDAQRYLRLMLKLVEGLQINKIETKIE